MKSIYRTRLANLAERVLGRSNIRTPLPPLIVLHSPELSETSASPEQIANARASGRRVIHIRFCRAEDGRLVMTEQPEELPYVRWSRSEDAPLVPTNTYLIDGDSGSVERKFSMEPAQDGAGCMVPEGE